MYIASRKTSGLKTTQGKRKRKTGKLPRAPTGRTPQSARSDDWRRAMPGNGQTTQELRNPSEASNSGCLRRRQSRPRQRKWQLLDVVVQILQAAMAQVPLDLGQIAGLSVQLRSRTHPPNFQISHFKFYFQIRSAPYFHRFSIIFVENCQFSIKECASISHIFVENGSFSNKECVVSSLIFVKIYQFSKKE